MDFPLMFLFVSSVIPGALEFLAALNMRSVLYVPGSLAPFLWLVCNCIFDVGLAVIILIKITRAEDAANADLLVAYFVLYSLARLSNVGQSLFLAGIMGNGWLRVLLNRWGWVRHPLGRRRIRSRRSGAKSE